MRRDKNPQDLFTVINKDWSAYIILRLCWCFDMNVPAAHISSLPPTNEQEDHIRPVYHRVKALFRGVSFQSNYPILHHFQITQARYLLINNYYNKNTYKENRRLITKCVSINLWIIYSAFAEINRDARVWCRISSRLKNCENSTHPYT